MPYRTIPVPGGSTTKVDRPEVSIMGGMDQDLYLFIPYFYPEEKTALDLPAELIFEGVFEYRWINSEYGYLDVLPEDFELGLIEILNSLLVENMAAKGPRRDWPGQRFGSWLPEAAVRHFRIGFDKYRYFEVIALDVRVRPWCNPAAGSSRQGWDALRRLQQLNCGCLRPDPQRDAGWGATGAARSKACRVRDIPNGDEPSEGVWPVIWERAYRRRQRRGRVPRTGQSDRRPSAHRKRLKNDALRAFGDDA